MALSAEKGSQVVAASVDTMIPTIHFQVPLLVVQKSQGQPPGMYKTL